MGREVRLSHLLKSSEVRLERFPILSGRDTKNSEVQLLKLRVVR